jgi:ATP-dependent Clp protease protease subunit
MTDQRRSYRPLARTSIRTSVPRRSASSRFRPGPSVGRAGLPRDAAASEDWEISINGDLTDKQFDLINTLIELPRKSRGTIWFDSAGGSAYVGLALCSIIRLRGLRVTGVVASECSSAAILPFAACERRFVTPHCSLLFHPIRWQSEEDVRLEEAAEWARHFKVLEEGLDQLTAKLFGISEEKVAEWTRPGKFVSGTEFVEAGLASLITLFDGDVWTQIAQQRT